MAASLLLEFRLSQTQPGSQQMTGERSSLTLSDPAMRGP